MRFWHDLLDSFGSDGGIIAVLYSLILLGMIGTIVSIPKSEDIIVGAFGALLGVTKSGGSNKERRDTELVEKVTQLEIKEPEKAKES